MQHQQLACCLHGVVMADAIFRRIKLLENQRSMHLHALGRGGTAARPVSTLAGCNWHSMPFMQLMQTSCCRILVKMHSTHVVGCCCSCSFVCCCSLHVLLT
jgi:hypothetical protein